MVSRKAVRKPRTKLGREMEKLSVHGKRKRKRKQPDGLRFQFVWTKVNEDLWVLHRRELWIKPVAHVQRASSDPKLWFFGGIRELPISHELAMKLSKAKATAVANLIQCYKDMVKGLENATNAK